MVIYNGESNNMYKFWLLISGMKVEWRGLGNWGDGFSVNNGVKRGDGERRMSKLDRTFSLKYSQKET